MKFITSVWAKVNEGTLWFCIDASTCRNVYQVTYWMCQSELIHSSLVLFMKLSTGFALIIEFVVLCWKMFKFECVYMVIYFLGSGAIYKVWKVQLMTRRPLCARGTPGQHTRGRHSAELNQIMTNRFHLTLHSRLTSNAYPLLPLLLFLLFALIRIRYRHYD